MRTILLLLVICLVILVVIPAVAYESLALYGSPPAVIVARVPDMGQINENYICVQFQQGPAVALIQVSSVKQREYKTTDLRERDRAWRSRRNPLGAKLQVEIGAAKATFN